MTRLGALLRNFRRKLYAKYIEPNLKNPSKLAVIPKRYRTIILNQEHWNAFVTYTQSQNFKVTFTFPTFFLTFNHCFLYFILQTKPLIFSRMCQKKR